MDKQLKLKNIIKYGNLYNKKFKNKNIVNKPIFLNSKISKDNKFEFNVELEPCKIYNQKASLRCWLFATLNIIKNDVAKNLNIDKMKFELSANYLSFYDKLEKSNYVYQTIIDHKITENSFINSENDKFLSSFLREPVLENGKFEYARELIKKYGLVPSCVMPETYNSENSDELNKLFSHKAKSDIFKLIKAKVKSTNYLYKLKDKMLAENYSLLAKFLGEPPKNFNYKYKNLNNKVVNLQNITPQDFHKKFCSINLDDYVMVGNVPLECKPYFKKYRRAYSGNVIGKSYSEFINLPFKEFQNLCIKQLKNGIPVFFTCDNRKYRDTNSTILDTRLFNFDTFGIKNMTKKQDIESADINLRHCMVFRGVHIENNKSVRWKVEDSAGEENRIGGYYIMNQNFFKQCVFQACIHKKFLSKKQLNVLNQAPILCNFRGLI